MPQKITFNDFSLGWIPSDNSINGRKNGLLQMDNLELDENGALTMIGGTTVKHTLATYNAHTLYSRVIGGNRRDYSANTNGDIFRNTSSIGSSGDSTNAAFGTAFDFVLACSGNTRKKDNGSAAVNLGLVPNTTLAIPTTSRSNDPFNVVGSVIANIVTPIGSSAIIAATYLQITADANGDAAVQTFSGSGDPHNLNLLTGVGTGNSAFGTDDDVILLSGFTTNPFGRSMTLDILLSAGNGSGDQVPNFYSYVVADISTAQFTSTGVFTLRLRRGDFTRIGSSSATWNTAYGFRITFAGEDSDVINILGFASGTPAFYIFGGAKAQNGTYQYMQVNVNNTGSYIAKSTIGNIVGPLTIMMGQALITPINPSSADAQCNEAWIYRRSVENTGGILDAWYRVKVFTSTTTFAAAYDSLSDVDALSLNIKFNTNLVSIASSTITDKIISIVGPIEGRWFYFTTSFMYPSDINNPDLVDPNIAIRTTGSSSEKLMWAFKVGEKSVLVGTSVDIYLLTGTFITQPDFTVDIYYDGYGTEYPPLTYDATEAENGIFYLAKDGWRVFSTNGETRNLVAPNTDRLYNGQTCYSYSPPALTIQPGATRFPVLVAKNKLWCFITGTNRCEVFDFTRNYWRTFNYGLGDVTAACSTQDGQILCFYGTDKKIREIGIPTSKLIDGSTQQTITFLTLVNDNGTPHQRKDSSTLFLRLYSGASGTITAKLTLEDGVTTNISTLISAPSIVTEFYLDLSNISAVDIAKTYQLTITGQVPDFRFIDAEIIFETRPLPVNFIRVQSNNYGTIARKRVYSIPFQIDTLSNTVVMTPIVDNSSQATLSVVSAYKESFNYKFPLNTGDVPKGRDYEYTLQCTTGVFEFFGFEEPRGVEVFPDPTRAFVIPVSNYGSTSRKRIRVLRFILDPLSTTVTFTPIIDGTNQTNQTYTTAGKRTLFYYYTSDMIGVDFSGTFSAPGDFELWEVLPPQEGDIEVFPELTKFLSLPTTNFGSPNKKRVRVWPLFIDPRGGTITFTPEIDGTSISGSTFAGTGRETFRHQFTTDVFGVDYGGTLTSTTPFELWKVLDPDVVEVLPIARRFDQVGPEELFMYGKIKKLEVRILPLGTTIPFVVYFEDSQNYAGSLTVVPNVEASYQIGAPKGTNGNIVRIELGPTDFDFHRYYMRIQVARSGKDTEIEWITLGVKS